MKTPFTLNALMHYSGINPLVIAQFCKYYKKYYDQSSSYALVFTIEMKDSFSSWQYSLKTITGKIIEPYEIIKNSDLKIIISHNFWKEKLVKMNYCLFKTYF